MVVLGMVLSSLMLCLLAQGTESAIDSAPQRAAGAYPKKGLFFGEGAATDCPHGLLGRLIARSTRSTAARNLGWSWAANA